MVPLLNWLLTVWINTGPLRNNPAATMKVAPVSESDLANARV